MQQNTCRAGLQAVDRAAEGSGRRHPRSSLGEPDGSHVVRQPRRAGVSVRAGTLRVQLAHASLEHGLLRPGPAGRHEADCDSHGDLRLANREQRPEAATQTGSRWRRTLTGHREAVSVARAPSADKAWGWAAFAPKALRRAWPKPWRRPGPTPLLEDDYKYFVICSRKRVYAHETPSSTSPSTTNESIRATDSSSRKS